MSVRRSFILTAVLVLLAHALLAGAAAHGQGLPGAESLTSRIERLNPLRDIVLPRLIPVIAADVSATYGDATLINRIFFVTALAMTDAAAPYHPTALGMYTRQDRQPEAARTQRNINIAMMHAAYHALVGMLPEREAVWREMLTDNGLDPYEEAANRNCPVFIGNTAGQGAVAGRLNDGMNQSGNYADTTGYRPVNTAYELLDPSRWQPGIRRQGSGSYTVQQFVTPQLANTEPFAQFDPRQFRVAPPIASNAENLEAYKAQADAVIDVSANLTDAQKLQAELFDNIVVSLTYSYLYIANENQLSPQDFARGYLVSRAAAMDASIPIWQEKIRYDGVRPFSAIAHIYGDEIVTAWAGPGRGTAQIPANAWQSYLPEADHPEYPSASTCGCYAYAQSMRRFFDSDDLNWTVTYPPGSSRIEPGFTPAGETRLSYATWTDFAESCGEARVLGGVHFQAAVDASAALCSVFGDTAYDYYTTLMDGSAEDRQPAQPLELDPMALTLIRNSVVRALPPEATSPVPESCERLSDTILVSSPSSGYECEQLDARGLASAGAFLDAVALTGNLELGAQVCFKNRGTLILIDESERIPAISLITSYGLADLTCGWVNHPGIIILASSALPALATNFSFALDSAEITLLNDCTVTTTHRVNFRAAPNGDRLNAIINAGARLTAFGRTDDWFNVVYGGTSGWISADYVRTSGVCE